VADLRLLRVLELAALRDREKVEARARELGGVEGRVLDTTAAVNHLVAEEAHADRVVRADFGAHGLVDFERETHARAGEPP
jgi:hypothetical protein